MKNLIASGDIFYCDLGETDGSIQGEFRMVCILDNHKACAYSPVIHIVPLTSARKTKHPLHFTLPQKKYGFLDRDSIALCEQYQLINKSQLRNRIGVLQAEDVFALVVKSKKNLPF